MLKYKKNIILIFIFVIVFVYMHINVLFASQNIAKKSGYNKLPSKGPIVEQDIRGEAQVINNDPDNVLNPTIELSFLKNTLKNAKQFDEVILGKYEQDNNLTNGKEPIEWQVIYKNDNGKVLLASKYILDCKKFNSYHGPVTWESSSLRAWLNNNFFYEAFSDIEKTFVLEVMNLNKNNHYYNTDCGNPTYDRVFCMSLEEAIMFFEGGDDFYLKQKYCLNPNEYRKCKPTPFAKAQGVRVSNHEGVGYDCGNYWLRTLGNNEEREWYSGIFAKYYAVIVQEPGYIKPMGTAVHSSDDGVRPCIWIDTN